MTLYFNPRRILKSQASEYTVAAKNVKNIRQQKRYHQVQFKGKVKYFSLLVRILNTVLFLTHFLCEEDIAFLQAEIPWSTTNVFFLPWWVKSSVFSSKLMVIHFQSQAWKIIFSFITVLLTIYWSRRKEIIWIR